MLFDGFRREGFRVLLHPGLELCVARFVLPDVILYRLLLEAKRCASHRVITSTDSRVTRGDLPLLFQRDFQPKPRQMQHTEWPCRARTYHWNIRVAHRVPRLGIG